MWIETILGVTKSTFLRTHVVPANDNDAFNDNKCAFCWGEYDDDHPAARILPCNHVFGRDCIQQIVDAPNGDRCPICKAQLFHPSIGVASQRYLESLLTIMVAYSLEFYHSLLVVYATSSPRKKFALKFFYTWCTHQSIPYWISKCVNLSTDLAARYPALNMRRQLNRIMIMHQIGLMFCSVIRGLLWLTHHRINVDLDTYRSRHQPCYHLLMIGFMATVTHVVWRRVVMGHTTSLITLPQGPPQTIHNRRDKAIVALAMSGTAFLVSLWDLWVVLCALNSQHPLGNWIGKLLFFFLGRRALTLGSSIFPLAHLLLLL